ncbi:uncharacterized protein LAESUDRAFT_804166 [Laetiporus sulphureus 93-53]|uniref:Phytanoyl-CoA dioxygenase family protein n=1 Tax=Laetiporus sulphureus 93-53 TaxID=1314785 RepID=A0A165B2U1_9APHY|nr:uncharacterized protein LAESUDRAFT_804166 [Laetiporus sulphureus 93-53]KZT00115.1 hypothetical protein LAESUDRAFT_804166 [Laetiporus sulphureus 93-53]
METARKQIFEEQGFVIVPNLIPPESRDALEMAAETVVARTRSGSWKMRRTVGRQFPPFFNEDHPDSWGVQHIMHPDLGEPAFAQWYTSDALVDVIKELLECEEDELQMELFNMLINPESHAFALRWHRDDVREIATVDEERKALDVWHCGVQWNTALYNDSCLYVVPGSHKVPRTPEQWALSSTLDSPDNPMAMPGAVRVTLQRRFTALKQASAAGETVFYNNNILHCATYDPEERRATLHASMGDTRGGATRARNVLQHGLMWMKEERFRETVDERGKKMLDRLIKLQESVNGDVGYSLEN